MKRALAILAMAAVSSATARADFITITVDGDVSDWGAAAPLLTDAADNGTGIDFNQVWIANDDDYIYVRFTLHSPGDPFTFQSNYFFDGDNDSGTGYNVDGLGIFGSEMLVQAGAGYQEKNGGFNEGGINGLDWLAAANGTSTEFEFRVSRAATYASDGDPVFTDTSIELLLQTDSGAREFAGDGANGIPYDFAVIPEPATAAFLLLGGLALLGLRRRR